MNEREKLEQEIIVYRKCAGMKPLSGLEMSFIITLVIADRERICEPLIKENKISDAIGNKESTAPAWQRLDKAVYEALNLAGLGDEK